MNPPDPMLRPEPIDTDTEDRALRPQMLFGTVAAPLNHSVLWSLSINTLLIVLGSLSRASLPLERIQAAIFVPRDSSPMPGMRYDPALGYYVPNTPTPAKPAPSAQTTDQDQTAEQESRQRLGFTNPLR